MDSKYIIKFDANAFMAQEYPTLEGWRKDEKIEVVLRQINEFTKSKSKNYMIIPDYVKSESYFEFLKVYELKGGVEIQLVPIQFAKTPEENQKL